MKILFVCIENSCRSQMAEGFARSVMVSPETKSGQRIPQIEVYSAGSMPSGIVNPIAVAVMKEKGINISAQTSKGFNTLPEGEFDITITMGCGGECPSIPAKERIDWQIRDPKGSPIEVFREVRDEIEKKVLELLK
ncbi:MAG: arsenate reductase ArsC [Nitrospinae bacterium]|nr:arsenate reductase ArsC [Nitrospinota bacterium]